MNRYLKLVNFEVKRFFKIYLVLIAITVISQIGAVIFHSNQYISRANEAIYENGVAMEEFIQQWGQMSLMQVTNSFLFQGPITFCIVTLIIYVFFIWYRDWLGKNTFIYRLLMLPTARISIYLAKATTIFLFVLGLLSIQLLLIKVDATILQWMVADEWRMDMAIGDLLSVSPLLNILFPSTILEFMINYGIGLTAVLVIFTALLFERSFRWKGIFIGLVYVSTAIFFFFLPMYIEAAIMPHYFYPMEMLLFMLVTGLIVFSSAILLGYYLLKFKITV